MLRSRMVGSRMLLRVSSLPLLLRTASSPSGLCLSTGETPQVSAGWPPEGRVSPMILYGSSLSPYVRKVLAFAGEKGIELELKPTGSAPGQPSAEFLAASPFRKMPAFVDGDFTLADSSAIIHYLEAKFPEPALIPRDPQLKVKTIWYEEFADTIVTSCGAKMFFNRVVAPRFFGRPGDLAVADAAEREELPPILDYLEKVGPDAG